MVVWPFNLVDKVVELRGKKIEKDMPENVPMTEERLTVWKWNVYGENQLII